ncbi:MAG: macro domain-containing protein [Caldisericaceae bacterium]
MKVVYSRAFEDIDLEVVNGDITQEDVDAIVNAANGYLSHGGGVALAIVRAGGAVIQDESNAIVRKNGPLKTGEAVLTSGGNLKAKYVIHTVGPQWGEGDEDRKLRDAIVAVLTIAKDNGFRSISIPAVSCGIFGFPKERGTEIIVRTVLDFIKSNVTSLEKVRFIGTQNDIVSSFERALKNA